MLLGLRDCDAVGCIEHGVKRNSKVSPSQLNPVDAVFRMAADMSTVDFDQAAQRLQTAKNTAPTTLASPVLTPDPSPTSGWQSARGSSAQLLGARPLDQLRSMSAEALGNEIASISPDYVAYRALFISAGFDGMLLCDAADDADLKQLVQDLGIASDIHRRRVLVQLRNVIAKYKQSPDS
jgi:hypothetical protein